MEGRRRVKNKEEKDMRNKEGRREGRDKKTTYTQDEETAILLRSKQNAEFFDFLDENRLIFVVLTDRFQNLF